MLNLLCKQYYVNRENQVVTSSAEKGKTLNILISELYKVTISWLSDLKIVTAELITDCYTALSLFRLRAVFFFFFLWKMHEPAQLNNMHNRNSEIISTEKIELKFTQAFPRAQIRDNPTPIRAACAPVPPESLPAINAAAVTAVRRAAIPQDTGINPFCIRYAASSVRAAVVNTAAASAKRCLRSDLPLPFCFNEKSPLRKRCHCILFPQRGFYSEFGRLLVLFLAAEEAA